MEIDDFNTPKKVFSNCTSDNFHAAFGVDLCLAFKRPQLSSLSNVGRALDLDNKFNPDEVDVDDEDVENDFFQMPSLILSGPYHYDVCDTHILEKILNNE